MRTIGPLLKDYQWRYVAEHQQKPSGTMLLQEVQRLQDSIPGVKRIKPSPDFLYRWRKQYDIPPVQVASQAVTKNDHCSDMEGDCVEAVGLEGLKPTAPDPPTMGQVFIHIPYSV
jgi:hypothetical protein